MTGTSKHEREAQAKAMKRAEELGKAFGWFNLHFTLINEGAFKLPNKTPFHSVMLANLHEALSYLNRLFF